MKQTDGRQIENLLHHRCAMGKNIADKQYIKNNNFSMHSFQLVKIFNLSMLKFKLTLT